VRRLRGSVNDNRRLHAFDQTKNACSIPDV
jgi:hypothetical protein